MTRKKLFAQLSRSLQNLRERKFEMLTTLRIKNLALVSDLTLELQPGFNAITGETGAGKSIIIGALNLVLGERADRSLIRNGCESCSVEAVFDAQDHRPLYRIQLVINSRGANFHSAPVQNSAVPSEFKRAPTPTERNVAT